MIVYGIKNCDTCRKALKELGNPEFVDVRDSGLPESLFSRAAETFGEDLLNRRSTTWRGLDEATREKPMAELLETYPTLMKRPLIDHQGGLTLGWGKSQRGAPLGG